MCLLRGEVICKGVAHHIVCVAVEDIGTVLGSHLCGVVLVGIVAVYEISLPYRIDRAAAPRRNPLKPFRFKIECLRDA